MTRLSQKLANTLPRDNSPSATRAKIVIRRNVLDAIGAEHAHVFDAFAGSGHMHAAVWSAAASYVGCDEKFFRDDRLAYVADNCRVMRAIDLAPFNVFDFDAYGSPWEQVLILIARRPLTAGERFGVVLTDGQGLNMRMGATSTAFAKVAGIRAVLAGMGAERDHLIDRAVGRLGWLMGAKIERRWEAHGKFGSAMRYIGLILVA